MVLKNEFADAEVLKFDEVDGGGVGVGVGAEKRLGWAFELDVDDDVLPLRSNLD